MGPQLAKLNEARVFLHNAGMGVTDTQYCLILLNALPASFEGLASTILASGAPSSLVHQDISARIINEEGRQSGPSGSSSLNVIRATPIKASGKKWDHSGLVCHYCNKKGHIKPNCHKKKKDDKEAEEKKKGHTSGSGGGGKPAVNSHVLIPTSASIKEVDNEISVSLYTVAKAVRWM